MVEHHSDRSGLPTGDRARLRFQLEHCSITEKSRRAAVSAAVRRSRPKTGGRKRDPYRPYPDADRFIAHEMAAFAVRLNHLHHPMARVVQAKSDAIRRCIAVEGDDHQPCGSMGCSRCRAKEASTAQDLGKIILRQDLTGVDRNRIRAATILLFAAPLDGQTDDPVGLANRVFERMQWIHGQARRIGFNFLLLPEFKILEPLEVMWNRHHRAYVDAVLPDWDRSTRVLVAHIHGLVILPEEDGGRTLHGLRQTYPSPRAVMLKGLYEKQSIQEAISKWMWYSGEHEARHDIYIRENDRLAKLYRASDFLLIDQILHELSDDVSIFEWLRHTPEDPDQWTWQEILEDLREVSARARPRSTGLGIVYVQHYWSDGPIPPVWRWYSHSNHVVRPLRCWSGPRGPPRRGPMFRETKLICINDSAYHALFLSPRHDTLWRSAHHFFMMMGRIDRAKIEAELEPPMTDDIIQGGELIPRIAEAVPLDGRKVRITWTTGETVTVDIAPILYSRRTYIPLCQDDSLFRYLKVSEYGRVS